MAHKEAEKLTLGRNVQFRVYAFSMIPDRADADRDAPRNRIVGKSTEDKMNDIPFAGRKSAGGKAVDRRSEVQRRWRCFVVLSLFLPRRGSEMSLIKP